MNVLMPGCAFRKSGNACVLDPEITSLGFESSGPVLCSGQCSRNVQKGVKEFGRRAQTHVTRFLIIGFQFTLGRVQKRKKKDKATW